MVCGITGSDSVLYQAKQIQRNHFEWFSTHFNAHFSSEFLNEISNEVWHKSPYVWTDNTFQVLWLEYDGVPAYRHTVFGGKMQKNESIAP